MKKHNSFRHEAEDLSVRTVGHHIQRTIGPAGHTPDSGVQLGQQTFLADDAVVCAVPPGHAWAERGAIDCPTFVATPMIVRDPSSNARWTVDAVLEREGLVIADPLCEAPTPRAALAEARRRCAPVRLGARA